jgi:ATP-binding cassette, subfamily C, bacterial CydD
MFDRRLWREAKHGRFLLFLTILFSALGGAAIILQAYGLSQVVAGVFLNGAGLADVRGAMVLLLTAVIARALLAGGREWAANRLACDLKTDLRDRLFAQLRALGPGYVQGEQTGELTAVLTHALDALDAYFSQYLPQLFIAALIPLSIVLVTLPADWLSALVLVLTAPLMPLFMVLIGRYAETLTQRQWGLLSRMSAHFLDVLQGLTTLKQLGQSRRQAANIATITDRFRETTLGVLRVAFLSALVLELLASLSVAIVAVSLALRLLDGHIPFQTALFILILAPEFYLPLRQLGQRFHAGMDGIAAAGRVFELLEEDLPQRHGEHGGGDFKNLRARRASVVQFSFHHVSVTYAGREQAALQDVSFTAVPGQVTALVGATGAGKSTIAGLLLGFVQPSAGEILLNDRPLAAWATADLRQHIAWVPQQPYLFDDTIANNIRLARPQASLDEVITAARQARLHDFVHILPAGYDTPIGERGVRLSGGQAQRLALARAFLKDAPLLILDEPTAHLDPQTEADILTAMQNLMAGRTTLVIAHRHATIRHAHQILVLDNGRLLESGSHDELMQRNGRYPTMQPENTERRTRNAPSSPPLPVSLSPVLPVAPLPHPFFPASSTSLRPTPDG